MAYTSNQKSTGLETLTELTLTQADLHIIGDVSDSGRAKSITQDLLEDYIANSDNFIDELTNNTNFQTEVNNFVTGGYSLEIEENGTSVETSVSKINILTNSPIVTNPSTGQVNIDLTNIGTGGGGTITGEQLHMSIFNGEFVVGAGYTQIHFLNRVKDLTTSSKKYGVFGMTSPSTIFNTGINKSFCYDYSIGKWFHLAVTNTSSGNYTLRLSMGDKSDLSTETNFWTCPGFSSIAYPNIAFVVDLQELKLYLTTGGFSGDTIDTTSTIATQTYVFNLSSATGGTITGTPTAFSGTNMFPTSTVDIPQINSTTKKFITRDTDNKYTYNSTTGITSNVVVNYGDYSGLNIVHENDILHKDKMVTFTGSSSGTPTSVYYVESSVYPDSNTVLNT